MKAMEHRCKNSNISVSSCSNDKSSMNRLSYKDNGKVNNKIVAHKTHDTQKLQWNISLDKLVNDHRFEVSYSGNLLATSSTCP